MNGLQVKLHKVAFGVFVAPGGLLRVHRRPKLHSYCVQNAAFVAFCVLINKENWNAGEHRGNFIFMKYHPTIGGEPSVI